MSGGEKFPLFLLRKWARLGGACGIIILYVLDFYNKEEMNVFGGELREKSVEIRVSCRQRDEAGEEICLSYAAAGRLGSRGGENFLTYEEPEVSGLLGTRTTLFFSDGAARLVRMGEVSMRLSLVPDRVSEGSYRTNLGTILLRARVMRLENEIVGGAGSLRILYTMEAEGLFCHENELEIEVSEVAGVHGH